MTDRTLRERAHDVDVTVWVGKAGIDAVVEELSDQLDDRELVKAKFLRAARGGTTTEELAARRNFAFTSSRSSSWSDSSSTTASIPAFPTHTVTSTSWARSRSVRSVMLSGWGQGIKG